MNREIRVKISGLELKLDDHTCLEDVKLIFEQGDSVVISQKYWEDLGKPTLGDWLTLTLSVRQDEKT